MGEITLYDDVSRILNHFRANHRNRGPEPGRLTLRREMEIKMQRVVTNGGCESSTLK